MASAAVPNLTPEFLAQDRRPVAITGIGVTTALSIVVVIVRSFARRRVIRNFGWDDAIICIAAGLNVIVMALSLKVLQYGAGRHIYALTAPDLVQLYKWLVSAQLTYMLALWVCRLSGLAFYARLSPVPQFRLYLRVSVVFVTAVWITQTLVIALQCIPLAALWGGAEGKCLGSKAVFISTAILTIICDSLILLLPLHIVFTIKSSLTRKIGLAVVLCFGIFAVITSVFRIVAMIPAITHADATWYFSTVMVWSDTEISTAIIALSLPALKGLFGVLFDREKSSENSSYIRSGGGGRSDTDRRMIVNLKSLRSLSDHNNARKGQRLYEGRDTVPNNVRVDGGMSDNTSEEILWDGHGNDGNAINVKRTVDVSVADASN